MGSELTDEIARAPFVFEEMKTRRFDMGTQVGVCMTLKSTVDPEYTFVHAVRVMKKNPTPAELVTAVQNVALWIESRFDDQYILRPEAVERIRNAQL